MANPQSGAGASMQQQAGAAPEACWFQFIQDLYPNLLSRTHFLPPVHFHLTPLDFQTIAGETVLVRDNPLHPPRPKRPRKPPPPPPPPTVAGRLYVDIPPGTRAVAVQDSDVQDDNAQQRCLRALANIPHQAMMVITSLVFRKYLSDHSNPLHAVAIAQLPTIRHPSIPSHIQDGECDIVIIHRSYGLMVGELKSVGSSQHFRTQPPHRQAQMIKEKIEKALEQLEKQETALRHLVHDMPHIRITKMLLLPNLSPPQLQSALHMFPSLIQALCQALLPHPDLTQALQHCLFDQDERQPATWWHKLHTGVDPGMTDDLYQRLVARFCGPASAVEVPTASPPHKVVVRSMGQAVAETGLRFSTLTLTPTQVTLLNTTPVPKFVHLMGPPGTGKTIVLLLKALQWARQGQQVVIVRGVEDSVAVTMLFKEQLDRLLSTGGLAPGTSTGGPGTSTRGPGTSTGGPGTSTGGPGTSTGGPGTSTGGPSTSTRGPGTSTGGPGTSTRGPGTSTRGPTPDTSTGGPTPGTSTGGSGTSTGGPGTSNGGPGTSNGGPAGTSPGGPGTSPGGPGTSPGGPGTSPGGPGTSPGGPGTSTGGPGTSTGGPGTSIFCCDFRNDPFDAQASVALLQQQLGPGPVLVLCDEVDDYGWKNYIDWIGVIQHNLPDVYCWSAGVHTLDGFTRLPPWLLVQTLQEALRCPPAVTTLLQQSADIQNQLIPQYSAPQQAVATQGPPVQELQHRGQTGHSGAGPWDCNPCADRVIDILTRQLRVGQPGHRLLYKDVWILYKNGYPHRGDVIVRRLQQQGLPVRPVSRPLSQADARDLALALSDQILVAQVEAVTGLERQVIIVLSSSSLFTVFTNITAQSRSSSFLCVID